MGTAPWGDIRLNRKFWHSVLTPVVPTGRNYPGSARLLRLPQAAGNCSIGKEFGCISIAGMSRSMQLISVPIRNAVTSCLVLALGAAPVLATSVTCQVGSCPLSAETATAACCCPAVDGANCGMACCATNATSESPIPANPQPRDQQERMIAWVMDCAGDQPLQGETLGMDRAPSAISCPLPAGTLQMQHVRLQT